LLERRTNLERIGVSGGGPCPGWLVCFGPEFGAPALNPEKGFNRRLMPNAQAPQPRIGCQGGDAVGVYPNRSVGQGEAGHQELGGPQSLVGSEMKTELLSERAQDKTRPQRQQKPEHDRSGNAKPEGC
jgi:hypothetical protein